MNENNVSDSIYLNQPTLIGTVTVTASRGTLSIRTDILINGRNVTDMIGFSSFAGWILAWVLKKNPLVFFFIYQKSCSVLIWSDDKILQKLILVGCMFLYVRSFSFHSRIFAHMETSLLPIKGCKFCPVLGSHGL